MLDWRLRFAFVSWMLLCPADACNEEARRHLTPKTSDRLGVLYAVSACLQVLYRPALAPLVKAWRPLSSLDATAADHVLGAIALRCQTHWDPDIRWLAAFHHVARSLVRGRVTA